MVFVTTSFSIGKCFLSTRKRKTGFSKLIRFEEAENLRFRDGLVWTVSLPAEIKLKAAFSNISGALRTLLLLSQSDIEFHHYRTWLYT